LRNNNLSFSFLLKLSRDYADLQNGVYPICCVNIYGN